MAQHTPGPWMQDEDRPFDILFDDRAGENVTPIIASVHTDNTDDEQWQADARLIAAAPDLLAAVKSLLMQTAKPDPLHPAFQNARSVAADLYQRLSA